MKGSGYWQRIEKYYKYFFSEYFNYFLSFCLLYLDYKFQFAKYPIILLSYTSQVTHSIDKIQKKLFIENLSFFICERLHIDFRFKIPAAFVTACIWIPILPLLLFLFVYFFNLSVLECELKRFYFGLFALLYIFRIIGQDSEFLWDFKLSHVLKFYFLLFFLFVQDGSEPMQFNNFLRIILFVPDMVTFFIDFLDDTRVKLSISWEDGLTMCSFFEELCVWLFEYFKQVSGHGKLLCISSVLLDFGGLLFQVNF